MSQEEIEKRLNLIDDMMDIEDEIIFFLENSSSSFIKNILEIILLDKTLSIQKLNKDVEKIEDFEESIQKHFSWIRENIDNDDEDFNNYRNKEIDIFKAYCLFYSEAEKLIYNSLEYEIVATELAKYFKALRKIYC